MPTWLRPLIICVCVVALAPAAEPADDAAAVNAFAYDLYRQLAADGEGLVVAPWSIVQALALIRHGAAGDTRAEIDRACHWQDLPGTELAERLHTLARAMQPREVTVSDDKGESQRIPGVRMRSANALWLQRDYDLLPDYRQLAQRWYDGGVRQVDFRTATDRTRRVINTWVSDCTEGRIADLLAPGTLSADTRLVATNALYLDAPWADPFSAEHTAAAPWLTGDDDTTAQCQLMQRTDRMAYRTVDGAQVVEIPYRGNDYAMLVVVPTAVDGLAALEQGLDGAVVRDWLPRDQRRVRLALPRWQRRASMDLVATLQNLGIVRAFRPATAANGADFSRLVGRPELHLGAAVHQTWIRNWEEGTEAAAATAVSMELTALPDQEPVHVRADRPFLYMIRHRPTGVIVFMGRVIAPSWEDGDSGAP